MLLLTGATGLVGTALLRRLTAAGEPVRCLVRDPRALGAQRTDVDGAVGGLADPASLREAVDGVTPVVPLAAAIRDQPCATIEDLNARATAQLAQAARRAGAERFVLFSALSAGPPGPPRFPPGKGAGGGGGRGRRLRAPRDCRPVDHLRPRRPVHGAAAPDGGPAGRAGQRAREGRVPADLGPGRRRLRGRAAGRPGAGSRPPGARRAPDADPHRDRAHDARGGRTPAPAGPRPDPGRQARPARRPGPARGPHAGHVGRGRAHGGEHDDAPGGCRCPGTRSATAHDDGSSGSVAATRKGVKSPSSTLSVRALAVLAALVLGATGGAIAGCGSSSDNSAQEDNVPTTYAPDDTGETVPAPG